MTGQQPLIDILYTDIGRGHPFYLDGLLEALVRRGRIGLVRGETDVLEVSKGLSRLSWQLARWFYRHGSSGGPVASVYKRLRANADYNRSGLMLSLMGRDIRRRFVSDSRPLVVAHPTLVGILQGRRNLIYQHGELVTPGEAVVAGASKVLVPTERAAGPFLESGYTAADVVVSGLCIEPALVNQAADVCRRRLRRIDGGEPLTGAFFSSGAEPTAHVDKLVRASLSAVRKGGKSVLFVRQGGKLDIASRREFSARGMTCQVVNSHEPIPSDLPATLVVRYASRREENIFTAQLFAAFDYFVAPAHERSNWAMGLGWPMFVVGPQIGPYAPLNRSLLLETGVAGCVESLSDADSFGQYVADLQSSGELTRMVRDGWGVCDIGGFDYIARFLDSCFA
ncbi:MAG: hypothetical protein ABII79_02105 [bacterium]